MATVCWLFLPSMFFIVIYNHIRIGELQISPTLVIMIHFTASLWALIYQLESVGEHVIYMLLVQVAKGQSEGNPVAWRQIAFKAN